MRISMKKYLFVGSVNIKEKFFEKAQKVGNCEFISAVGEEKKIFPEQIENIKRAIKISREQPVVEQAVVGFSDGREIVNKILWLNKEITSYDNQLVSINSEIGVVEPFGEFDIDAIQKVRNEAGVCCQFFSIHHDKLSDIELPKGFVFVNRKFDFDYFMYIGKEQYRPSKHITEVVFKSSLMSLIDGKTNVSDLLREREGELKSLAKYERFLHEFLLYEMNSANLNFVRKDVEYYLDDKLFVVEGWVPANGLEEVLHLTKEFSVYASEIEIDKTRDVVPTCLKNAGASLLGQDLVEVYDTPSSTDKDPSGWVVWSFLLFFGMIISDAGYGLIFLLVSSFLWFKFGFRALGLKKRVIKLFMMLSCVTILWGVVVGSYFSIKLKPENPLNKISVIYHMSLKKVDFHISAKDETFKRWQDTYPNLKNSTRAEEFLNEGYVVEKGFVKYSLMEENYNTLLMEIAILVGIIHLAISFIRNFYRNWSGIGWILAMIGGYLFFPKIIGSATIIQYLNIFDMATAHLVGKWLLAIGVGLALLLSIIQEKWAGLGAIFKIVEVFSDTLSYLRLYALGLASMVLASTFNEIGAMVGGGVLGAVVMFFGHFINICLGVAAGVIHGLRLNFLEWYHHSFEGGGKKFNPLRLMARE